MFKILAFSFAILAGSTAMAQSVDLPQGDGAFGTAAGVDRSAPYQIAGPVRIRFRKLSDVSLASVLSTAPVDQKLAYHQSVKNLPID